MGEELPVPEAFRRWPSDYKKERAFAVALKRFGLSYSKPIEVKEGIGIVFAEYTTQKAVAQVGTRKKTHDRELNRKSKHKTRQRKKTKKRLRTPARRKVTIERKDRTH
ncbi:MAG: hypothetical protein ABI233_03555 [Chthoniobacterales bacterium]